MSVRQYRQVNYFCNSKLLRLRFIGVFYTLITTFLLGVSLEIQAESLELNINTISPLKILNIKRNACGSGFLWGHRIITNYHVANSVCPQSPCANLSIVDGENNPVSEKNIVFSRAASAPAYDLAIIEFEEAGQSSALKASSKAVSFVKIPPKQELSSLSFPNCKAMSVVSGENLSNQATFYLQTSLALKHGSSGGPIFDKSGQLVGIISEADTLIDGLFSMFLGSSFKIARAIPVQRLNQLLSQESKVIFDSQVKDLLEFYFQNVMSRTGLLRLEESSRFLSKVKALATENLNNSMTASSLLLALDNYPYPLFLSKNWGLGLLGESGAALALAASLEQYGLHSSFSQLLDDEEFQKLQDSLHSSFPANTEIFSKMISSSKETNYPGATRYLLNIFLPSLLVLVSSAGIWLFGVGFLMGRAKRRGLACWLGTLIWSFCVAATSLMLLFAFYPG